MTLSAHLSVFNYNYEQYANGSADSDNNASLHICQSHGQPSKAECDSKALVHLNKFSYYV